MQISPDEVRPGLVAHLSPQVLRELGGATTNAELTGDDDRAVADEHEFLILCVDEANEVALAVPLFSKPAVGNVRLDEAKKGGLPDGWIGVGRESYFSRWQHWWIPLSSFPMASSDDFTNPTTRHTYAEGAETELASIAGWRLKNRSDFRGV